MGRKLHDRVPASASEMSEAGFGQTSVLAIEGPGWLLQDFEAQ